MVNRIDPPHIAGVPVFRSTLPGTISDEADLVWEHKWSSGFFRTGLYYLDNEQTWVQRDVTYNETIHTFTQGDPYEVMDTGYSKGLDVTVNQMLMKNWGCSASYQLWETHDDIFYIPDSEHRLDHMGIVGLSYVSVWGGDARLRQTYRYTNFKDSDRPSENILITDLELGYDMPRKIGRISLMLNNLFDESFNWISNSVTTYGRSPSREWWLKVEFRF